MQAEQTGLTVKVTLADKSTVSRTFDSIELAQSFLQSLTDKPHGLGAPEQPVFDDWANFLTAEPEQTSFLPSAVNALIRDSDRGQLKIDRAAEFAEWRKVSLSNTDTLSHGETRSC